MKRAFQFILCILPILSLAGCNDGPGEYGNLYVNPIIGVDTEGATVEIDQENKEISLVYERYRELSGITMELKLEPDVKMISPSTNPFTMDFTDGEFNEIKVFSLDRTIPYRIKAYILIDISEPITSFTARAGDIDALVKINHETRTISVNFEHNVDLSQVIVDYTLAEAVTVAAPAGKTWDLTQPVKLELRKDNMAADYTVTGTIGIDDSEPFRNFTATSLGSVADIIVDHTAKTLEFSFDGGFIDITAIEVEYVLDDGFTVVEPVGKVWDLSDMDENPVHFVLEKNGFIVSYEIIMDLDVKFDKAIVALGATVGGQKASVMINNEERWVSVAFENAANLGAVDLDFTLEEHVSVTSHSGTTWDISSAGYDNPLTFTLEKYGIQETYSLYASEDLFVPPFYQGMATPEHWQRYIKGIPPTMAVYMIPEIAGVQTYAFAVAIQLAHTEFKTVGGGYYERKPMSELIPEAPNSTLIINGTASNNLFIKDGIAVNNVVGNQHQTMMVDANGTGFIFSATNRGYPNGAIAGEGAEGSDYYDMVWNMDTHARIPDILYGGGLGDGFLNIDGISSGAFPGGIYAATDPKGSKIARAAYAGSQTRDVFMYFVCEGGTDRSVGVSDYHALEVVRDMGGYHGGLGPIVDPNIVGIVINGQSLIRPTSGTEGAMSFAYSLTAK